MRRTIPLLLAALLLTGCGTASPDDAYVSTVRESVPALASVPDKDLTGVGHQVCDILDDRGFNDGMVEFIRIAKNSGFSAKQAGAIAGAASAAYCPQHADEF